MSFTRVIRLDQMPLDHSFYVGSPLQIPAYNPHRTPNTHIPPDSPAGILGLTPEELTPILREQQQIMRDELAQPPPILTRTPTTTTTHLIPPTQELGLTKEEVEEVIQDQEDWLREEEMRQEMGEYTVEVTHHQQREQDENNAGARSPPPPFECDAHATTDDDDDAHGVSSERDESNRDAIQAKPNQTVMIEPIGADLVIPGVSRTDWAVYMDEEMGLTEQGEYAPAICSPIPRAPWYLPTPPTSDHTPPRTRYTRPRSSYRPTHTHYTPRTPCYHPCPHPQRARYHPREN
jgi:hypothetical protein